MQKARIICIDQKISNKFGNVKKITYIYLNDVYETGI